MPLISAHVSCPVHSSFRVAQVSAMFDLPLKERSEATFAMELPAAEPLTPGPSPCDGARGEGAWQIGVIAGPSGSGKTTLAKAAYGSAVYTPRPWPTDRAIIDGFEEGDSPHAAEASAPRISIQEITQVLTAVGLGSPPAWLRPYHVLSNGERFRCDLARALLQTGTRSWELGSGTGAPIPSSQSPAPLLVFDEFTSVVDRTVAQIASAAISKSIRSGRIACRLVAVTCHRDVVPWLAPDWVADLATGQLTWGRLRRPELRLTVRRATRSLWPLFARHHYLSGELHPAASCWGAWGGDGVAGAGVRGNSQSNSAQLPYSPTPIPVSFCAVVPQLGKRGCKRISRIVTLPDYQGLGIGMRLVERVCEYEASRGFAISITASHPAIIAACRRSPRWICTQFKPRGHNRRRLESRRVVTSHGRCVATFKWVGSGV